MWADRQLVEKSSDLHDVMTSFEHSVNKRWPPMETSSQMIGYSRSFEAPPALWLLPDGIMASRGCGFHVPLE